MVVVVKRVLISIPLALIWVMLSITQVQAPLAQKAIAIPTTPVTYLQSATPQPKPQPQKRILMRTFVVDRRAVATITGYTNSFAETGKTRASRGYGITSTGTRTQQGRTIAVDPKLIPYGSLVRINGIIYVAEDTGGAMHGYTIDMYFAKVNDALQWGRRNLPIEIGHFQEHWVSYAE